MATTTKHRVTRAHLLEAAQAAGVALAAVVVWAIAVVLLVP